MAYALVPFALTWLFRILTSVILYGFLIALYRLTFHPLSKYPGPLFAKVSDLYIFYHAHKGDAHTDNQALHEKYGPFVRIGPNRMSINSNTAIKQIYGLRSNVRKSVFYKAFPANRGHPSLHTAIDKKVHARKRRVLAQGFSENAIRGLEPQILACTETFSKQFSNSINPDRQVNDDDNQTSSLWGKSTDVGVWVRSFTFDVMGGLVFSKSYRTLESPENQWMMYAIGEQARIKYSTGFWPFLYESGLDKVIFRKLTSIRERVTAFAVKQLTERMKVGKTEEKRDLVYYLGNAIDPETGERLGAQELGSEAALLIAAGSDTSSAALAAAFFYLVRNEAALQKVTKEVRSTFLLKEDVKPGNALSSCRYLRACIDEAMRLCPPIPSLLPREVLPGGLDVDGHHFSAGIDIGVSAFTVMRNPLYYPEPLKYDPSRWLEGPSTTTESIGLAQSAFCPFSVGPRVCIAKGLAYVELMVAMSRILWEFDLRATPGSRLGEDADGNYEIRDFFITNKQGPLIQVRPKI